MQDERAPGTIAAPRTIITGGTRGIGAAVVRRLVRAPVGHQPGHEVVALGLSPRERPPTWTSRLGDDLRALRFDHADVSDADELAAAFQRANADGAGLTGLVVSAGVWEPSTIAAPLAEVAARYRRVIDINLLGAVHAVAAFLAHQRDGRPAAIVLVGSTAGQRGEAGHGAYAASKAALTGLAKSWAVELAPRRVRVNVAAPGWVDTDMTAGVMGDALRRAEIEAGTPAGRVAEPEDLAGPIAFLLSDDAAHVTGTVLSVNGGSVMASF